MRIRKDVSDLGVVLLKIIDGRPVVTENEVTVLKDLVAVHKECSDESLKMVMEICIRFLSSESSDRPSVEDVLWNLQFAPQVQEPSCKGDFQNKQEPNVS
ncbi:hypothetical protein POTOM_039033 [Populus tomentosa]|uniref:Uncharacterized protein n=1 Tax=Populus tomentosa TaxID=118781 RepID=A0A8X8CLQ6_POPTO|nr:hypothetical protein POTOM_039033 [Populus tomentosa]